MYRTHFVAALHVDGFSKKFPTNTSLWDRSEQLQELQFEISINFAST